MHLISDLEQNKVLGFNNPDKTIETLLSKIFFFGKKVLKLYKWDKAFYGDLSDIDFRKQFIAEDFFWNNIACPEIYTKLLALKYNNGKWQESSIEQADDLCIVMNKLKSQESFTDFAEKDISFNVLEKLVSNIIQKQRKTMELRKKELSGLLSQNLKDIEKQEIEDLRDWAYMAADLLPKEKVKNYSQR